jgi:uncharacterized membrane protein
MTSETETIYFDAVLTPNRSLSERGFAIAMALIAVTFFLTGLLFWSMGAGVILGFFGLDILAIWLAFRLSFRRQREETRITVTARMLRLHHRDKRGREKSADVPTAFARIELDAPATPASGLRIAHGNRAWVVGRFLTQGECASLAAALKRAIGEARSERFSA